MTDLDPASPSAEAADVYAPATLELALLNAIGRRRGRRRHRVAVAAGALVAVAAVLLAGGVFSSGPSRVLAIDSDDGSWVTIQILDGKAGADQMTSELQDAGINGEVKLVPAPPDRVGQWIKVEAVVGEARPGQCLAPAYCANPDISAQDNLFVHDTQLDGDVLRIRSDAISKLASAQLIFYLGRAPEDGEQP